MKEYEQEEDFLQRVEQKQRYKAIIDLTKVVKEVETTSVIKKVAVFPEKKRDYVMSLLNTEESIVNQSGISRTRMKTLFSPQSKNEPKPAFRRVLSKYLDSKLASSKVNQKK